MLSGPIPHAVYGEVSNRTFCHTNNRAGNFRIFMGTRPARTTRKTRKCIGYLGKDTLGNGRAASNQGRAGAVEKPGSDTRGKGWPRYSRLPISPSCGILMPLERPLTRSL